MTKIKEDKKKSDRECYICGEEGISGEYTIRTFCGIYFICSNCSVRLDREIASMRSEMRDER